MGITPALKTPPAGTLKHLATTLRFAILEVSVGDNVDNATKDAGSLPQGMDTCNIHGRLKEVGMGNGVVKNATYMASNPNKQLKAASKQSRPALVVPTVAGQSAEVVDHVPTVRTVHHVAVKIMEP
ncbi:hypothetical protein V6N13_107037 [Hibiscus sabdariffa]